MKAKITGEIWIAALTGILIGGGVGCLTVVLPIQLMEARLDRREAARQEQLKAYERCLEATQDSGHPFEVDNRECCKVFDPKLWNTADLACSQ